MTSFFFGGSAWGACYHIGVYKGLLEKYGDDLKTKKIIGNSSGSLIALGVALGKSVEDIENVYIIIAKFAEIYGVFGKMSIYNDIAIRELLKNKDDYLKINGKLHIVITKFFQKTIIVNNWYSNDDVINTIHASTHIPFYCTNIESLKYSLTIDGGFSMPICKLDENTITISPVNNLCDIYPNKLLTIKNCLFPMKKLERKYAINLGYNDIINYKKRKKNIKSENIFFKIVIKCLFKLFLSMIWILRILEDIFKFVKI